MSTAAPTERHPDADLIEQLGGSAAVAALLGFQGDGRVQRVQNWKYRGIPDAVKLRLRYELRPDIFGEPPAATEPVKPNPPKPTLEGGAAAAVPEGEAA